MIQNQIIVALDNDVEDGLGLIETIEDNVELSSKVYGYKVGSLWILDRGLDVLDEVWGSGLNIILDMQKWPTDIPDVVKKQIGRVADKECVDELIACPMGGGRMSLETFVDECLDNDMRPLCVLEMTHPESDSYLKLGAMMAILNDAANLGIDGYIIPATKEPKGSIKTLLETHFPDLVYELYTTGYKVQGGQAQPMIDFGVKKFIMGRAIYEAEDVEKAILDAHNEINGICGVPEDDN